MAVDETYETGPDGATRPVATEHRLPRRPVFPRDNRSGVFALIAVLVGVILFGGGLGIGYAVGSHHDGQTRVQQRLQDGRYGNGQGQQGLKHRFDSNRDGRGFGQQPLQPGQLTPGQQGTAPSAPTAPSQAPVPNGSVPSASPNV